MAWNLWLYAVILHGHGRAGDDQFSKGFVLATSFALIAALIILARVGFGVGTWVRNAGSVFIILVLAVLVLMPLVHTWQKTLANYYPLHLVSPPLTPQSDVQSKWEYSAKTVTVILGANALGLLLYWLGRKKAALIPDSSAN